MKEAQKAGFVQKERNEQSMSIGTSAAPAFDPKAAEYARVLTHAIDTFGSRANADAWLNEPNRVFGNKSPLQVLTLDPAGVEEELVRIDHGMFL